MKLITKIKEYREKLGIKQAELSELVNVRRETIVCLEKSPILYISCLLKLFIQPSLRGESISFNEFF